MSRYRPPQPKSAPYITPEGVQALQKELQQLWKVERPAVTATVSEAAKNGDRSENGDYIYGKRRLREIDRRVRYLAKRLDELTIVDRSPAEQDKVFFGAWVTLENEKGETRCYRIVGADEFDLKRNMISVDSPIARAVLGKKLDDEAMIQTPEGNLCYSIIGIKYSDQ